MIIPAGGFRNRFSDEHSKYCVQMNGANIFNFTIKKVPILIAETLNLANKQIQDIDYYIFHQSNKFIINHLKNKLNIPDEKVPIILHFFGNTGGPSIPLTITQGDLKWPNENPLELMLLGYGVGLSWGSALVQIDPDVVLEHLEI